MEISSFWRKFIGKIRKNSINSVNRIMHDLFDIQNG
jgi:hypothetical protein